MNNQDPAAMLELVRRAKAAGMDLLDIQLNYHNQPEKLEAEIERRINEETGTGWKGQIAAYEIRRKRIAAAYLAGASLQQLSILEQVSTVAIHNMVRKELPTILRLKIAAERTARGRRREPLHTPTQISAMLGAVSNKDAKSLPVIVIATRMQDALTKLAEVNREDESDPYLRDEAQAEATRHLPGQDGRGERDRTESVPEERAAEGNS